MELELSSTLLQMSDTIEVVIVDLKAFRSLKSVVTNRLYSLDQLTYHYCCCNCTTC